MRMVPKLELPMSLHLPDLLQFRRNVAVRHGIDELQKYIDFEIFRDTLEGLCNYSTKGRPHYDVVQMFKILILQTLYNLSDEEMEFQLPKVSDGVLLAIALYDEKSPQNIAHYFIRSYL